MRSMSRSDFVLQEHMQAAWDWARRENHDPYLAVERERRSFEVIRNFDPTGGRYHQWISRWRRNLWAERDFRTTLGMEELEELRAALKRFDAIKDTLAPDRRDIGQYRTIEDLRSIVPTRIARSERRLEKERLKKAALAESTVLFEEGPWRMVRLDGYAAARFWGLGTKWCTTSSFAVYERYAFGGTLIVLVTPMGRFQLSATGQFMDERDSPADAKMLSSGAPKEFMTRLHALLAHHRPSRLPLIGEVRRSAPM